MRWEAGWNCRWCIARDLSCTFPHEHAPLVEFLKVSHEILENRMLEIQSSKYSGSPCIPSILAFYMQEFLFVLLWVFRYPSAAVFSVPKDRRVTLSIISYLNCFCFIPLPKINMPFGFTLIKQSKIKLEREGQINTLITWKINDWPGRILQQYITISIYWNPNTSKLSVS